MKIKKLAKTFYNCYVIGYTSEGITTMFNTFDLPTEFEYLGSEIEETRRNLGEVYIRNLVLRNIDPYEYCFLKTLVKNNFLTNDEIELFRQEIVNIDKINSRPKIIRFFSKLFK